MKFVYVMYSIDMTNLPSNQYVGFYIIPMHLFALNVPDFHVLTACDWVCTHDAVKHEGMVAGMVSSQCISGK